ncbi:hypothetical protein D3C71_1179840 [compost metagenome]
MTVPVVDFSAIDNLLNRTANLVAAQSERRTQKIELDKRIDKLQAEFLAKEEELDKLIRAAFLISSASDKTVEKTLGVITGVINKALAVIFPHDPRVISIVPHTHKSTYPHFNVVLTAGVEQRKRKFSQSGSGLAQIVSFLFTITMIDARKARRLIIMDEILSGLHPDAKELIRDLILAVSHRFQFVIVEYGLDIGKQYEMKRKGKISTIEVYDGKYYEDIQRKKALKAETREAEEMLV